MWIDMDYLCATFFSLDDVCERNGMCLSHITAHNQDAVAIDEVLWKGRSTTTTKCCAQTGHCGAVSNTSLVLDGDDTEATIEQLLNHIIFFDVQCCTAQRGNAEGMIDLSPIFKLLN